MWYYWWITQYELIILSIDLFNIFLKFFLNYKSLLGGTTVVSSVDGAHEGSVLCIIVTEDGNFISGGKDQNLIEYNGSLEPTGRQATVSLLKNFLSLALIIEICIA